MEIIDDTADTEEIALEQALLLYTSNHGHTFVTNNPVNDGVIYPGTILNVDEFIESLETHRSRNIQGGVLTASQKAEDRAELNKSWEVLFSYKGVKVWTTEAKERTVLLQGMSTDEGGAPVVLRKKLRCPKLLWVSSRESKDQTEYFVFTYRGDIRGKDTELWVPQFFNVYPQGRICWGTVKTPKWFDVEDKFFGSMFTHSLQDLPMMTARARKLHVPNAVSSVPFTLGRLVETLINKRS